MRRCWLFLVIIFDVAVVVVVVGVQVCNACCIRPREVIRAC